MARIRPGIVYVSLQLFVVLGPAPAEGHLSCARSGDPRMRPVRAPSLLERCSISLASHPCIFGIEGDRQARADTRYSATGALVLPLQSNALNPCWFRSTLSVEQPVHGQHDYECGRPGRPGGSLVAPERSNSSPIVRLQSPAALLRPSGEEPLDAVQYPLVVVGPLQRRSDLT